MSYYKPGIVNGDIILKLKSEIESLKKENEELKAELERSKYSGEVLAKAYYNHESELLKAKEAINTFMDGVYFMETEHNASYVISEQDKNLFKKFLTKK